MAPDELEARPGEYPGELSGVAASVVMKVLYGARQARWDLSKAVSILATRFTRWSKGCDRALHRMMSYIDCTSHLVLRGWVGDGPDDLLLRLFSDADFAGDRPSMKSTTGGYLALAGPNTWFPLGCKSKRQTATSHSTTESEIVSADDVVRTIGLPALDLWEEVLKRKVECHFHEDNQACLQVIKTGRNPTMRHITRTHGVNTSWLHERVLADRIQPRYVDSKNQAADIFTKAFTSVPTFLHVRALIQVVDPSSVLQGSVVLACPVLPGGRLPNTRALH